MKKIELLAPAGNLEILKVAVQAGANAVYLAGKNFGARSYSDNFTREELIEGVNYAHLRNVKIYITVNTIIYEDEFDELKDYLKFLYEINVDALIIQDLGLLRYVRMNYPDFEVHASTQMNIFDEKGASILKNNGVKRVVLARETDIDVAKQIASTGIEVEIFIHGALCFCASGNCLMSYAIGKRSGNRGKCAQPCRKKYTLLEDGKVISDKSSFLSMKDLNTIHYLDEILSSNITSLKIEGRMKSKEYVYSVVSSYRKTIDYYYKTKKVINDPLINEKLLVTFNREFTKGYLLKESNHLITNIKNVNHQGLVIGKIINRTPNFVEIKLSKELQVKDAIRITGANEIGFVVTKMFVNGCEVKRAKANDIIKILVANTVKNGSVILKTQAISIEKEVNDLMQKENIKTDINAKICLYYQEKSSLELMVDDIKINVFGNLLTEVAKNPISSDFIKERLDKIKDTPFRFNNIIVEYDNYAFVSVKEINELRRNAILQLMAILPNLDRRKNNNYTENNYLIKPTSMSLEAVVHTKEQFEICKNHRIEVIYTDYESMCMNQNRLINDKNQSGLVHNLGMIKENTTTSCYFNIVNTEAVRFLMDKGINKIYLSNELEVEQLVFFKQLALKVDLGIMVYGKMDLMVTKHCFISKIKGSTCKNCHLCYNKKYYLLDEYQNKMEVFTSPSSDCNLRILDYNTRNWLNSLEQIKNNNIRKFLLVFTTESEEEVNNIILKYKNAIK